MAGNGKKNEWFGWSIQSTVTILKIRTPEKNGVIILKLE